MKWWHWLILELLTIFGVIAWIYFFPSEIEYDFAKGMIGFVLFYAIENCKDINKRRLNRMKKIKGYNIVKEKTNELLVSIEIGNDEVIERNGYKVIPFYEEGNPTIEQNCGENRVEGGVLSVSGSVSEKHTCKEFIGETVFKGKKAYCKNRNCDLPACDNFKPKKEKHCRPFKDCSELIEYWYDFTGVINCSPKLFMPEIWVKHKRYGTENLIMAFDNDNESIGGSCVFIQDQWFTLQELYENFVFLDGSCIGAIL